MLSSYDLRVLADQRIEQRRAEANRERMVNEARRSNTVMTGDASEPPVGPVLRLRSHLLHGLTLSFDTAARATWSARVADVISGNFTSGTTFVARRRYPSESAHWRRRSA
jgi:hypothetical protein